jgi:hypothetical protein
MVGQRTVWRHIRSPGARSLLSIMCLRARLRFVGAHAFDLDWDVDRAHPMLHLIHVALISCAYGAIGWPIGRWIRRRWSTGGAFFAGDFRI